MEPIPECLACGSCCFGEGPRYVPVTGDDHAVLGDAAERLTTFVGNRCYMQMHAGHCAALELDPAGRFVCSVYEHRPSVCRELARGSGACRAELAQKRERSQHALLQLHQPALFP
jgi:Fe-S-cluster containining protein